MLLAQSRPSGFVPTFSTNLCALAFLLPFWAQSDPKWGRQNFMTGVWRLAGLITCFTHSLKSYTCSAESREGSRLRRKKKKKRKITTLEQFCTTRRLFTQPPHCLYFVAMEVSFYIIWLRMVVMEANMRAPAFSIQSKVTTAEFLVYTVHTQGGEVIWVWLSICADWRYWRQYFKKTKFWTKILHQVIRILLLCFQIRSIFCRF